MTLIQQQICLYPPAKVNLILRVGNRLPNGYHNLWSLMQMVDLTDELTIRVDSSFSGIRFECEGLSMTDPTDNLVYRAADLALQKAGAAVGVEIFLRKQIPVAAGLGGGSSDAAATIMGLNRVLKCGWSLADMIPLGQRLGSDVPFFFSSPTAVIQGLGEQISPITLSGDRWIVLINPGFPIHTKLAYQRLDDARGADVQSDSWHYDFTGPNSVSWDDVMPYIQNDFENVLLEDYPELAHLKSVLLQAGAEAALVSGSGATMFGIFSNESKARLAESTLGASSQWRVFVVPVKKCGLFDES
ncbi:MAG: 4-(cytidine 5'-diphospho)-2-C-methyl-D-erythritol kinase [Nitrospirae bacterium]|nr:4-(cytidine 5'-diphospho)-2-C-methyl-D-erythritol kinase [Nitrospirota bacterium]MDA1302721.1 4-(cytidine 5'-diphospho)-2-C-methyl-D-erythritol kinase [Nitrospirota bacterium]